MTDPGAQIDIWDAVYGPVGDDGYPKPLWDHVTGKIDRPVAIYMRDHGYDLRYYLEQNWSRSGDSAQQSDIYCGDMDNFYLADAVYLLDDFLRGATKPLYGGKVVYGRPMKGHGWQPMTNGELIQMMADQISRSAPKGTDSGSWKEK